MKKKLSILSISVLLISGSVYASFPVKNTTTSIKDSNSSENVEMNNPIKEFKKEFKEGKKLIRDKYKLKNNDNESKKSNGLAVTGFVLSLVGLFLFGFILGLLAIIFSAIGLGRAVKDSTYKGKGLAIAGLIIGIIDIAAWIVILALLI